MNRISKDLKKDAEKLLPDERLKENIKGRLFPAPERKRASSRRGLTFALSAVACVLVIAIALGVIFSLPSGDSPNISAGNRTDTLFLIDINPSFEIIADKDGTVTAVTGVNSDARIVLLGKNYNGGSVYDVCTDIISTSVRLGYVTATNNLVNILAYNEDGTVSSEYLEKLTAQVSSIVSASGGTVVASDGEEAKQKLIDEIVAAYGDSAGLGEKTVLELHRLLKQYDITKEKELDELEDLWEEELEKAGFDDDTMEDVIDKWKEENLKPLGEELEDGLEYYIDIYEIRLMLDGVSEREAEKAAEEKEYELKALDRHELKTFIDAWWEDTEKEFFSIIESLLISQGRTESETAAFLEKTAEALDRTDTEDRHEIVAEFVEEYYESLLDPEEGDDLMEDLLEDLFDED